MPKFIMLAGAPADIKWREEDMTVNDLLPPFRRIVDQHGGGTSPATNQGATPPNTTTPRPVWRSIPLNSEHLATGWSQHDWLDLPAICAQANDHADNEDDVDFSFATTTSIYDDEETNARGSPASNAALSQFLEQSFALHEEAPSSQVTPAAKTPLLRRVRGAQEKDPPDSSVELESLADASQSSFIHRDDIGVPTDPKTSARTRTSTPRQLLTLPYLADIAALPTAAALMALEPQTVTVDLLVGVFSVSAARTVTIRRTRRDIELIEVLVGDETGAGFSVTFWLGEGWKGVGAGNGAGEGGKASGRLRAAVEELRAGDVVGLKNVALSCFRRKVHGQSLGGRRGAQTSVVKVDSEIEAAIASHRGSAVLVGKVERVRAWTRNFVRPAGMGDSLAARKRKRGLDDLPPDETQ